jgi:hypothetical protein
MEVLVRRSAFAILGVLLITAATACEGPVESTNIATQLGQSGSVTTDLTASGVESFTSRTAFVNAVPDLLSEQFEDTEVEEDSAVGCPGPINSTTDNACFVPGAIIEGISIRAFDDQMAVLTPLLLGLTSTAVGTSSWGVASEITFPGAEVSAVGASLLAPAGGPAPITVEVFGPDDSLLGSMEAQAGEIVGEFWGIVASAPIGRVVFTPGTGVGLLIDEVLFGGTSSDPVLEVAVEVQQDAINPESQGVIPVALLSAADFDATAIDPSTVRFGPGGAMPRASTLGPDVDGDGLADALLHFRTPETELTCGDAHARLTGETVEGVSFEGTATVHILCTPEPDRRGPERRGAG